MAVGARHRVAMRVPVNHPCCLHHTLRGPMEIAPIDVRQHISGSARAKVVCKTHQRVELLLGKRRLRDSASHGPRRRFRAGVERLVDLRLRDVPPQFFRGAGPGVDQRPDPVGAVPPAIPVIVVMDNSLARPHRIFARVAYPQVLIHPLVLASPVELQRDRLPCDKCSFPA